MIALANGLASTGLEVDLVFVNAQGELRSEVSRSVNVVDLKKNRTASSVLPFQRYLVNRKPGTAICVMQHIGAAAIAANLMSSHKSRIVVSIRNTITPHSFDNNRARRWVTHHAYKWIFSHAAAFTAVSEESKNAFCDEYCIARNRVSVIHNSVDVGDILERAKYETGHPWLDSKQVPVVLSVGRLTRQKGYPTLLKAFAILRRTVSAKLVILGEGELRRDLETLAQQLGISDDMALTGFVSNPYAWMRRANVFVLASAWEGLPGVLLQAMACGTPVIATDCPGGNAEILEGGTWGSLVPVGDSDALARQLAIELANPSSINPQPRAAQFSPERTCRMYTELITKLEKGC